MPRREDIKSVLVIGAGPIVIGQACEFDYSGTQAVRVLKAEGLRVILANSNPATIMTDRSLADATYVEPLEVDILERIIIKEKPDAILSTMGGQTALNLTLELDAKGILAKHGVTILGANVRSIELAEDREEFQAAMIRIGVDVPRGGFATTPEEAEKVLEMTGLPAIIRPSFTLGGVGGSVVYNREEFAEKVSWGIARSPSNQVLIEEALTGWKEFELEVMRDKADNCVVVCSIENLDPLGVHTGDSITVAPQQTLTDKEYQRMRNVAFAVMREVGVETGGSNVQFGVHPKTGRLVVIEMNPRVSRSSALASKATGFPIARIATQLALGYTLDEIPNAITEKTPASFEPALDYVVVKIPRWTFEKFPTVDQTLGSQMKSVGEVMAIGRTFPEALQKAIRSLDQDRFGLGADGKDVIASDHVEPHLLKEWRGMIRSRLSTPRAENIFYLRHALKLGMSREELNKITGIDLWFLDQIAEITEVEKLLIAAAGKTSSDFTHLRNKVSENLLRKAKQFGFSDRQLAHLLRCDETMIRRLRDLHKVQPVHLPVDTCAAEFEAFTPYYYSSYEGSSEVNRGSSPSIIVLGSGPNRIGQGIEFDYCCVQASLALKEEGYDSVMVNCNPETVSTDYDISSRLYFEPITVEDVLAICEVEKPDGIVVQFGGQTPLKIAEIFEQLGYRILGTSPARIADAEDREKFGKILRRLNIPHPAYGIAGNFTEAGEVADGVGYPVLVRPSFVLGGRAMEIVYDDLGLATYLRESAGEVTPEHPVLIDRYLEDAFEFDVDAVSDGKETVICGIMQHIEEAGVHSGDSACVLPPYELAKDQRDIMVRMTKDLARALDVVGLMNVQFAYRDNTMHVIEVNPRASRTIPFVSKVTGKNWVNVATRCLIGQSLEDQAIVENLDIEHIAVKEVVFPFSRFEGVNTFLGPEMRSTGEVMGIGNSIAEAYSKALYGSGTYLPDPKLGGKIFISVNDRDKPRVLPIAKRLIRLGFEIVGTGGTAAFLSENEISTGSLFKVNEGRPNVVDLIKNDEIKMLINTPLGRESHYDERIVGETAYRTGLPLMTTLSAAEAALGALERMETEPLDPISLQSLHDGK